MGNDEVVTRIDLHFGEPEKAEHGFRDAYFDNIAENWRMECLCGFITAPDFFPLAAEELNDHWTGIVNEARKEKQQ
jgi:hypothetical protein